MLWRIECCKIHGYRCKCSKVSQKSVLASAETKIVYENKNSSDIYPADVLAQNGHVTKTGWKYWSCFLGTSARAVNAFIYFIITASPPGRSKWFHRVKARLHVRFFMRFRCNSDAILRTKPAPAYPTRIFSRVTLRQNTAKLAEIGKKSVFK